MGEREIIKCCFIKAEAVCKLLSLVTLSRSPPRMDQEDRQPSPVPLWVSGALPPLGARGGDGGVPWQREGLARRRVWVGGCRKERVLVSHYRP